MRSVFLATALFREHVLNGDCDMDRGSMLVYLRHIGVRHYACTGCRVVALRKPGGLCACGTRWNVGGGEQGARVVARDGLDPAGMDGRVWYATRDFTTTLFGVDMDEAVEHRYRALDKVLAYFAGAGRNAE